MSRCTKDPFREPYCRGYAPALPPARRNGRRAGPAAPEFPHDVAFALRKGGKSWRAIGARAWGAGVHRARGAGETSKGFIDARSRLQPRRLASRGSEIRALAGRNPHRARSAHRILDMSGHGVSYVPALPRAETGVAPVRRLAHSRMRSRSPFVRRESVGVRPGASSGCRASTVRGALARLQKAS